MSKSEIRFWMASFSFSPCLSLMRKRVAKSEAIQYVVLGPRKSAMPLVRNFSENDKIFRREKKYVE